MNQFDEGLSADDLIPAILSQDRVVEMGDGVESFNDIRIDGMLNFFHVGNGLRKAFDLVDLG